LQTPDEVFRASLYEMDLDRVRYSISRYLRSRIVKIEENLDHINRQEIFDMLSIHEKSFASKLMNLTNNYMEEVVLNRLTGEGFKESIDNNNLNTLDSVYTVRIKFEFFYFDFLL
jgi:hypothetical protein